MGNRIVVIGAGAVGGYVGVQLAAAGQDVTLVDGWDEHVDTVRARGFALDGMTPEESVVVPVRILHERELGRLADGPPVATALIAVKSYDTERAVNLILPFLAPDALVVSLQNGINEGTIAALVGRERTAGIIAARIAVELDRAGHVRRMVPRGSPGIDVFRVGELDGTQTARIEALGELIGLVDSVKVTTNLAGERWSKLCVNAMRNGVSAATGLSINALDRHPPLRRFGIKVAGEAIRVGQLLGYELEPIGTIAAREFALAAQGDAAALGRIEATLEAAAKATWARSDAQRPSMGQDVGKGRRTEVEEIYGVVIDRASEVGLPAPANEQVRSTVRAIERGELRPSPDNLIVN